MEFYSSIVDYYDYIFPFNTNHKDFVLNEITDITDSLLDIGCGTGTLTYEISKKVNNIKALDYDKNMVKKAKLKYPNLDFRYGNMLNINSEFKQNNFDIIYSFGNTLVHLNSLEEVKEFLEKAFNLLNNKGKVLIQILNYDYILSHNIKELPLVDNEKIKFIRNYQIKNNLVEFKTNLTIKDEAVILHNIINLLPILKFDIEIISKQIGFANIEFYSDFMKNDYNEKSLYLVFKLEK